MLRLSIKRYRILLYLNAIVFKLIFLYLFLGKLISHTLFLIQDFNKVY